MDFSYESTGLGEFFLSFLYGAIILGIPGFFKKRSRMLSIISVSLSILSIVIAFIYLMILVIMWWNTNM